MNPPGRNRQKSLWLRTRLSGPPLSDPVLNLWAVDERCQAFLDGTKVPCFGGFEPRELSRYPGKAQIFLSLGRDYQGKVLLLHVYSPYYSIGIYGQPHLGEREAAMSSLVQRGISVFAVGIVLLALGLGVLALFAIRRSEIDYLLFGGLSLDVGIYLISRAPLRAFLLDDPLLWRSLEMGSLPLIGALTCWFIARMVGDLRFAILRTMGWLLLSYGLCGAAVSMLGLVHVEVVLRGLLLLQVPFLVSLVLVAAIRAWRKSIDARILFAGLLITGTLSVYDVLMSLEVLERRQFLVHYAIAVFILTLGILLARRFLAIHKQLGNYSALLQLSFTATSNAEPGQHAHRALREVVRLFDAERALLFLVNQDTGALELAVQHVAAGPGGPSLRSTSSGITAGYDHALVEGVLRQRRPLIRAPLRAPARSAQQPSTIVPSVIGVPLLARGRTMGVIYLQAAQAQKEFTREDAEILVGLGNQVVLTQMISRAVHLEIEGMQAKQRLAEQSDLLTAAARMAKGDLLTPIQVPPASTLAMLAQVLDEMRRDLLGQIRRLETNNKEIRELNEELRRQIEQRSRRLMELVLKTDHGQRSRGAMFVAGELIGEHYRVIRTIGQGASGQVYEVERTTDGRHLAAKVLTGGADQMAVVRFAREAQILARLNHPNLVAIMDVDVTTSGVLFIVMEMVPGTPLRNLEERYGMIDFVLPVLHQIASSLQVIHAQGIVHRDLKPANIVISEEGKEPVAKLLDFGVATLSGSRRSTMSLRSVEGEHSEAGVLLGTPMYLAPELVEGSHLARPSSDMFSFGVIAFELLTRTLPFSQPPVVYRFRGQALASMKLIDARPDLAPLTLGHPQMGNILQLIERCLSDDPEARPTSAEFANLMSQHLSLCGSK